ncbi:MAG: hypothetical protein R3335_15465, partial [Anaerolineales bacterium]|nr:hypothetical protein [Anaerolineales bacterium]
MTLAILFLCPHNAAKSVIAAAYAGRLAAWHGIDVRIRSAGTDPDAAAAPAVVSRLQGEGLDVSRHTPRKVTGEDFASADWIISIGDDIEALAPPGKKIERWDDVPAPSQDMDG